MKTLYLDQLPSHWENTAEILNAVGDATRQRILLLFDPGEELSIKTIADLFPVSRTTITYHIAVLEKAGLLRRRKEGRDVLLTLDRELLHSALKNVLDYIEMNV